MTTTTNNRTPDIVVTRHPALVAYLIAEGIVPSDITVMDTVTANDVRGRHVVGVLPLHLAAEAASVTTIAINYRDHRVQRGREIPLEVLREVVGDAVTYQVRVVEGDSQ